MNHIELFAGCGGLSLGLETVGFKLLLANELSPMAAETFAYNHLGIDLENATLQLLDLNGLPIPFTQNNSLFKIDSNFHGVAILVVKNKDQRIATKLIIH